MPANGRWDLIRRLKVKPGMLRGSGEREEENCKISVITESKKETARYYTELKLYD